MVYIEASLEVSSETVIFNLFLYSEIELDCSCFSFAYSGYYWYGIFVEHLCQFWICNLLVFYSFMWSIYVFPVFDLCLHSEIQSFVNHAQVECCKPVLYVGYHSLMDRSPIFVLKFGICLLVLLFKTPASFNQSLVKKKNQLTTQIIRFMILLICLHGKEMREGESFSLEHPQINILWDSVWIRRT